MIAKADAIARMTAFSLGPAMLFDDQLDAAIVLQGASENAELVYLRALTAEGAIFAEYVRSPDYLPVDPHDDMVHHIEVAIAPNNMTVGRLQAGYSRQTLVASVDRSRVATAVVSVLVFLLGSVAAFAISSVITAPLREILEATSRVDRGDLTQRVEVRSSDEVGRLAESFNAMVDSVEERTASLEQEILERQKVESALLESEAAKRALLNAIPDHMFRVDRDGIILETRGNQKDFVLPSVRFVGRSMRDVLTPDAGNRAMEAVSEALQTGRMSTMEMQLPYGRGASRQYEARVVPVAENQILAIVRDITREKEQERATEEAERALEEQRTLSMRSDRLRSLGEMAAGIAHELNQPLVGVRGLAEHTLIGLERKWDLSNETLHKRLTGIVEQTDRMSHIIEHVRMFAREAGEARLELVSMNEVAQAAVELLGAQFSSHGLLLELQLGTDLPQVLANRFSLEEVLFNLLGNARDAVESHTDHKGAPSVILRTEHVAEGVRVLVVDNGGGIPAEIQDRVWEPFFTTKDPDKGTGLGLAITRTIVEQFKGNLHLESTLGSGTSISVTLPGAA